MPMPIDCGPDQSFTRLYAHIVEEDSAFTVRVRLVNHLNQEDNVLGEEIARTFEMASLMIERQASLMIERLATRFEIDQSCISIKIVMSRLRGGTIH